jgi:hypothetical protein
VQKKYETRPRRGFAVLLVFLRGILEKAVRWRGFSMVYLW